MGGQGVDVDVDPSWLATLINRCENLTSLVAPGAGFLDHTSIERADKQLQALPADRSRLQHLHLLDASHCNNITAAALSKLLLRAPRLYYLDVSRTTALLSPTTRKQFTIDAPLDCLCVLKVRACGLQNPDVMRLFPRRGRSVPLRCLDLRNNPFGDEALRDGFFTAISRPPRDEQPPAYSDIQVPSGGASLARLHTINLPALFQSKLANLETTDPSFTIELDKVTEELQAPRFLTSLAAIQVRDSSAAFAHLTHLYVAGSKLTVRGIVRLLERLPLEAFDCGDLYDAQREPVRPATAQEAAVVLPAIAQCLTLRYLRISHYVITGLTQHHDALDPQSNTAGRRLSNAVNIRRDSKDRSRDPSGSNNESTPPTVSTENRGATSTTPSTLGNDNASRSSSPFEDPNFLPGVVRPKSGRFYTRGAQWTPYPNLPSRDRFMFEPSLLCIETLVLTSVPPRSNNGRLTACLVALLRACGDIERLGREYCKSHQRDGSGIDDGNQITGGAETDVRTTSISSPLTVQKIQLEITPVGPPRELVDTLGIPANNTVGNDGANQNEDHHTPHLDSAEHFANVSSDDFSFFPDEKDKPTERVAPLARHADADVVKALAAFRKRLREAPTKMDQPVWSGALGIIRPVQEEP